MKNDKFCGYKVKIEDGEEVVYRVEGDKIISGPYYFQKRDNENVYWVDNHDIMGEHIFSFDKKILFNLFSDYPHNLTKNERDLFNAENPYWKDFFSDRE